MFVSLIITAILSIGQLAAQNNLLDLDWKKVSTENGLSNRVANSICQDDNGFIWIGTNDGLNKLNGDRVISFFNSKENLQSNFISNLQKVANNKIFVSTNSGCILMNCNYNKFEKIYDTTNELVTEFFPSCLELNNKLWIFGNKGIYKVKNNKVISFEQYKIPPNYFITKGGSVKRYFETVYCNGFAYANMGRVLLKLDTTTMQPIAGFVIGHKNHEGIKDIIIDNNILYMPTWGNGVVSFDINTHRQNYYPIENDIVFTLSKTKYSHNFFVGTQNGYSVLNTVSNNSKQKFLNNEISKIFVDNNGTSWLLSASGAYYNDSASNLVSKIKLNDLVNKNAVNLIDDKRLVNYVSESTNYFFLGLEYANGLAVVSKKFELVKYIPTLNTKSDAAQYKDIKYVLADGRNYWITSDAGLHFCDSNFNVIESFSPSDNNYVYGVPKKFRKIFNYNKDELLIQATTGIVFFNKTARVFSKIFAAQKNEKNKNLLPFCTDLCIDNDKNIFASTENGIVKIDNKLNKPESIHVKSINSRFNSVVCFNNNLFLATDAGLVIYNLINNTNSIYTREHGLSSSLIYSLVLDKKSKCIWIATANGLNKFNIDTRQFEIFNKSDGLPDGNIEGCLHLSSNNEVIVGNINYITTIASSISTLKKKTTNIKIINININDADVSYKGDLSLINVPTEKNTISITLGMPELYLNNVAKYFYYFNNKWFECKSNEIQLSNLISGSYEVAISSTPYFTETTKKFTILVATPLHKKIWFLILLACVLSILIYSTFKYRINKIKNELHQKNEIEKQIQDLKETAFRAQMNPHFMFNTLNAINAFIIESKTDLASDYLIMFSKLMRNILENSKHSKISLQKELDSLRLYLELESVRLEQGFDYEIVVDKKISQEDIFLPPLILQPFVENSIWHGLRNIKQDGKVWINVNLDREKKLNIEIYDNGIGYSKSLSEKNNAVKHKSYGVEITKERINLLNPKNSLTISDRISQNKISGTIVMIKIYL